MPDLQRGDDSGKPALSILVADDSRAFAAAIRGLIRCLGHSVVVVGDGLEAIEAASRQAFDYIFLDAQMPGMGGYEAAGELRRGNLVSPSTRLVGVSAEVDADRAREAGMDDFLPKPIRLGDLSRIFGGRAGG